MLSEFDENTNKLNYYILLIYLVINIIFDFILGSTTTFIKPTIEFL